MIANLVKKLIRRKHVTDDRLAETDLARVLTTFDLTALGIGTTLGAGAYVIAGTVAKKEAGPAVILAFFIAAVASILAGLCYAEFGARVPKTGSAYIYTYVTVGEFIAFVIGWNLILEYVIGAASVARAFSGYFDDLIGHKLIPFFNSTMPMHVHTLAPYADILAFAVTMFATMILAFGVKESARFTNLFTGLNLLVLSYIIICGAFIDDPLNWHIPKSKVPDPQMHSCSSKPSGQLGHGCCENREGCGDGGFAPYGFNGVVSGAATCFFAFVGFDAIATTGEEVMNPQKAIPVSIILSLLVIFVFYSGISITITMMAPYFDLDSQAPFAVLFDNAGWTFAKYIVSIGAICALCTSLLGGMFPMPRVVLAMARDGVIFRCFSRINSRLKTPLIATLFTGTLAGVMATIFDVKSLVDMMSIGTLLAYTLVSASVLMLRYDISAEDMVAFKFVDEGYGAIEKQWHGGPKTFSDRLKALLRPRQISLTPTPFSAKAVKILTFIMAICILGFSSLVTYAPSTLFTTGRQPFFLGLFLVFIGTFACCLGIVCLQPQSSKKLPFTVPLVPLFPATSVFFNIYLMLNLDYMTWVRFGVWMFVGFVIYFGYGIRNSSEADSHREESSEKMMPEFGRRVSSVQLMNAVSVDSSVDTDS